MGNFRGNYMTQVVVKQQEVDVAKQKERSELEHLRSTVKNQRSQIKNLKKELDRQSKRAYQYHDFEERIADQMIEEEHKYVKPKSNDSDICPECDGPVETVEMGSRVGIFCKCGYRKTKKS